MNYLGLAKKLTDLDVVYLLYFHDREAYHKLRYPFPPKSENLHRVLFFDVEKTLALSTKYCHEFGPDPEMNRFIKKVKNYLKTTRQKSRQSGIRLKPASRSARKLTPDRSGSSSRRPARS